MIPDWQCDGAQLYNCDARELLPDFKDGSFDAVIIDIPYAEVNRESNGLRSLDKGAADDQTFDLQFVVDQCARLGKSCYVWCGIEQISGLRSGFVAKGMSTRLCGWEKTNPSPMNGEHLWLSSFEACVFARHANAPFFAHCESPIWRYPVEQDQQHPTQKSLQLFEVLIKASVPKGGIVLDFCMGSGTCGLAAMRHGRRFVGIELVPEWYEVAKLRIGGDTPLIVERGPVQTSFLLE